MISIIIPVYNTGRILNKCLRSVCNQTCKDIEIIIVNDHSSKRKTNQIISKWVIKDPRIRLIDKDVNEGVDSARITGINNCHGEYLTFVDSDDWFEKDAIEVLYHISQETGADVVIGKARQVFCHGLFKKNDNEKREWMNRNIDHKELMNKYFLSYFGCSMLPVSLCSALYRTSVVKNVHLSPSGLFFGEDLIMSMNIFPNLNSLYATDKITYNYNIGFPGGSDKYLNKWLENARKLHLAKMKKIKEYNLRRGVYYQSASLVNYMSTYVCMCFTKRFWDREKNIEILATELKHPIYKDLHCLFDTNYKDKEKVQLLIDGKAEDFFVYIERQIKKSSCVRLLYTRWQQMVAFSRIHLIGKH